MSLDEQPTHDSQPEIDHIAASPSVSTQETDRPNEDLSIAPKPTQHRLPPWALPTYFGIAVLSLLGGAAWVYFFGIHFWPILAITLGLFLLLIAVARWRKSWRIGLGSAAAAGIILLGSYYWYIGRCPCETKIAIRIVDPEGSAISRASVILLHNGETPIRQTTDEYGLSTFIADSTLGEARIIITANTFQAYEEAISLSLSRDLSITLRPLDENLRSVLVRVVNKRDLQPIQKASVQLIVGSDPFKEFTDDNGLAKFDIEFSSDALDADLTVDAAESNISTQNIVLYPDQLQDVRIDADTQEVNIAPVLAINRQDVGNGNVSIFLPEPVAQQVNVFPDAPTTAEEEPNDEQSSAQELSIIGADHPIAAAIDAYKDIDYFAFDAVAGQTYVIELYAVDSTLGLSTTRYTCFEIYNTFKGLRLAVYDPGNNPVSWQCAQNAGGNSFEKVRVKAEVSGRYVIEVAPQADTVIGGYRLRVAPKYDEEGAAWIENSLEPNNDPMNAFPIRPGLENTITSAIESRGQGYLSDQADIDWYTFNAQAGRSYVVELVGVEDILSLGSTRYTCYDWYETFNGLGLAVLDPNLDLVKSSCMPTGAGDVHNIIELTTDVTGPYYIRVFPQVETISGIYSIRVLPKHDEPGAAYDPVTLEPDNRLSNASPIDLKDHNNIHSALEERTPGYSTNNADVDWYYFTAKAGISYVIEIVNIADTLKLGTNRYNCYDSYDTFKGVGIAVFNAARERQAAQCYATDEGEVHTSIEFQALLNSEYYIQVFPHVAQGYGDYEIRIREK